MRRMFFFASRNRKEMLRDPLSLIFGVGFPVVLLILLHIIQSNIPQEANMNLFDLTKLTPGIGVFGLSFIALFAAMLISKDRTTSLMLRLFASPLRGWQFILGYLLPLVPMSGAASGLLRRGAGARHGLHVEYFPLHPRLHPDRRAPYGTGLPLRQPAERQGRRRCLRGPADQLLRMAVRHLVFA